MEDQHVPEDQAPADQAPPYVPPGISDRRPVDLERFSIRGRRL